MTQDNNGNGESCHFIERQLAVRPEHLGQAIDLTGGQNSGLIEELYGGSPEFEDLSAMVSLVDVDDPHAMAQELAAASDPIPASPIHAVGFQGHTKAMSGTQPESVQVGFTNVPAGGRANIVAVVDSGIARSRPPWMGVIHEEVDLEDPDTSYDVPASHGTFVASVIRQITPDHVVSLAAARPDSGQLSPQPTDDGNPTNELEVAAAVIRLIRRHGGHPGQVKALNISLGAYQCHPDSTSAEAHVLTMRLALEAWRAVFPEAPIFAAGGNSISPEPVYPAAWDDLGVRAVAAGRDQSELVWDDTDAEKAPASARSWITDGAWGSDVFGLSGQDQTHSIKWSGSSFATAVATASYLKGELSTDANGITWWPEDVAGLQHG